MTTNILIVPGYHGSGDAHWQSWLQRELPQARRLSGVDWEKPVLQEWSQAIVRELNSVRGKTVIVAHSFGCLATALAVASSPQSVAGILLVAPADPERFDLDGLRVNNSGHLIFKDSVSVASLLQEAPLDAQGLVIGSRNDPWMKLQHAYAWSKRWAIGFHDAGNAGHINTESGFGPWPLIKLLTLSLYEANSEVVASIEPHITSGAIRYQASILSGRQLLYA